VSIKSTTFVYISRPQRSLMRQRHRNEKNLSRMSRKIINQLVGISFSGFLVVPSIRPTFLNFMISTMYTFCAFVDEAQRRIEQKFVYEVKAKTMKRRNVWLCRTLLLSPVVDTYLSLGRVRVHIEVYWSFAVKCGQLIRIRRWMRKKWVFFQHCLVLENRGKLHLRRNFYCAG
jgi:hypothetical protein